MRMRSATGLGLRDVDVVEQHRELLAAVARGDVDLARHFLQHARDAPQHLVADRVAVAVVDLLEVVDVAQQQRDLVVVALRALRADRRTAAWNVRWLVRPVRPSVVAIVSIFL